MRNRALKDAIKAAGGVTALAREIDVTSQAVSQWDKVPANRVLAVEKATGVSRQRLRPDLFGEATLPGAATLALLRKWRKERAGKPADPHLERDLAELRANRIRFRMLD
jgi:DNA-binding transcriptional regulator YdaS (Cro superfamily)